MRVKRLFCISYCGDEKLYYDVSNDKYQFQDNNPKLNEFISFLSYYRIDPVDFFTSYEGKHLPISGTIEDTYNCTSSDIISVFDEYMDEKGISHYELARRMEVAGTYVSSLFKRRYSKSMTLYTIDKVSTALNLRLSELFQRVSINTH